MLQGRCCLVTGAGGGMGRAAVIACAHAGASVLAADLNSDAAAETVELAKAQTDGASEVVVSSCMVDVADEESVRNMVRLCVERLGRIDCALNAAGVEGGRCELAEMTIANFDRVMSVNTKGVFLCLRAQIAQMLSQAPPAGHRGGDSDDARASKAARVSDAAAIDRLNYSIVNLASTAAQAAMAEFAAYSASKHAIIGLTRTAAKEYAGRGIRVNALCPSTTDTPMVQRFATQWPEWQAKQNASFPVGRIGRAEEGEPRPVARAQLDPAPTKPAVAVGLSTASILDAQLRIPWSSYSLPLVR